MQITIYELVWD